MKTVIEMAREAGWDEHHAKLDLRLERFAAIVREDEREKQQEPVAWAVSGKIANWSKDFSAYKTKTYVVPVYTTPPTAAMAARQMRDAAANECRKWAIGSDDKLLKMAKIIKALPIPGENK